MDRGGPGAQHSLPAHPAPLLSAQDVALVAFHRPPRGQRGYDAAEVDAFLDRVEGTMKSKDILTREDVLNVKFSTATRDPGYDVNEVNVFMELVADTLRSTPQRAQASAPAKGAHATSQAMRPAVRLSPDDVAAVRFHKPRPGTRGYHEGQIDAFLDRIEQTLRGRDNLTAGQVQDAVFGETAPGTFGYDEEDVDTFLDLVVLMFEVAPPPRDAGPPTTVLSPLPQQQQRPQQRSPQPDPRPKQDQRPQQPRRPQPAPSQPAQQPALQKAIDSPKLTAADIRNIAFHRPPRGRRGYQESQVDAFLDRIEATLLGQDNLTSKDVRDVRFSRPLIGRRGYDETEVDGFLGQIEQQLSGPVRSSMPTVKSWKDLRQLRIPQAASGQRGYRTAQVDRMLEEIGVALDGMLGASSDEVMKARFSYALLSGQGYDTSFIDELLPLLATELRRQGK
ncbi:DivIVA domain-containing protein [Lentzea flaviverrucosa]|uniref:Cell wall synthesis protein Wag31 n=1 Tax=Lentzea flaviverrucosa TaxID=200379 RepID=A0A1H9M8G8_9PSEU|nr:DivIVA domain-containing protein [Lentzea flaviverrucosa]RDI31024.1 DivIVA domain-containing protein [Lentzea flaviverrucosa]SER20004.1 DivIVA domain-containing protein [Lentzea flaviverrucosa]